MKKWLALFLAVAMMATLLVGCNNTAGNASGEDNSWEEVESSGKLVLGPWDIGTSRPESW